MHAGLVDGGFIIAPKENKPGDKDATGAFQLGANAFQKIHGLPQPVFFQNHGGGVKKRVLKAIADQPGGWDVFAYFGHGTPSSLESAEIKEPAGAKELAAALRPHLNNGALVLLYACSTGAPGGFASWLQGELGDLNIGVFAHTSRGHTFAEPNVVYYPGGDPVVARGSPLWKAWSADMIDQKNDLWARYPFMNPDELAAELTGPEYLAGRWKLTALKASWHNVFFMDQTVLMTGIDGQKYVILDEGAWRVEGHDLKLRWSGGNEDRWPLHLSLRNQNVFMGNPEPLHAHATRTEAPNVNQRGVFHKAGVPNAGTGAAE